MEIQTETDDQLLEQLAERIFAGFEVSPLGDVALIGEDYAPSHTWKLGRVEPFAGRDGLVRSSHYFRDCVAKTNSVIISFGKLDKL